MRVLPEIDALVLTASNDAVRRDAEGVPIAFRVLRPGTLRFAKKGRRYWLPISKSVIEGIVEFAQSRGNSIPIDAEHFLRHAAKRLGMEEIEVSKLLGEKATAGLVELTNEGGELWANVKKWSARARELLKGDGLEMYAYFSPVLRGIPDAMHVSSIALTNDPAMDGVPSLVLSGAGDDETILFATNEQKEMRMNTLMKLAALLGLASVELDGGAVGEAEIERIATAAVDRIEAAKASVGAFFAAISPAVELSSDATLQDAAGVILSQLEAGKVSATELAGVKARLGELEAGEKDRLIVELKADGRLTEAMEPWAKQRTVAALTAWAENAPVVVPQDRKVLPSDRVADDVDELALTDADVKVARACGLEPKRVAEVAGKKFEEPVGA